jgi:hypothetical protein
LIEADVVHGFMVNDELRQNIMPVMAHPPNDTSDVSLASFLRQIETFNDGVTNEQQKGVRLDFKSTAVFQNALETLRLWNEDYKLFINADLFSGPVNNTATLPVDPNVYFTESKKFTKAILSPGWTTRWFTEPNDGSYTREQIDTMIDSIRSHDVKNHINFPIRAGIAANSLTELTYLYNSLKDSNEITFTVWSSFITTDYVDIENLRKVIFTFGIDKVYIDVPEVLYNQLQLDVNPFDNGSGSMRMAITAGLFAVTAFIGRMFL